MQSFKYLGHFISSDLCDDIQREIRNMFFRVNVLLRKFMKCSVTVKTLLFKTFCLCWFDVALSYNIKTFSKFQSFYNKCIKIFFGYRRSHNVTLMLNEICIPSFDTMVANCRVGLKRLLSSCNNNVVCYLNTVIL